MSRLTEMLQDSHLRLTVQGAIDLMLLNPAIRESRWLTALTLAAVERSGYDRGHSVAISEAAAERAGELHQCLACHDRGCIACGKAVPA